MADLDERDPRLHMGDCAHDQHGDDAMHFQRGKNRTPDDSLFLDHAPVGTDRGSTELRGASNDQGRIDDYRRQHDAPNVMNDAPAQQTPARADDYAKQTLADRQGGKPHTRQARVLAMGYTQQDIDGAFAQIDRAGVHAQRGQTPTSTASSPLMVKARQETRDLTEMYADWQQARSSRRTTQPSRDRMPA